MLPSWQLSYTGTIGRGRKRRTCPDRRGMNKLSTVCKGCWKNNLTERGKTMRRLVQGRRILLGATVLIALAVTACTDRRNSKPNVLFIAVDDLNDWITLFDPRNPIRTPNIERLAAKGALFTHAYCSSPACNPSRASLLTGKRPHKTGIYGNKSDWRGALPEAETIQQYFMKPGYYSAGAGKIFHHHWDGAFHDTASFDDFQPMPDTYPDSPIPDKKLNGFEWYGSKNTDWGAWPLEETDAVG